MSVEGRGLPHILLGLPTALSPLSTAGLLMQLPLFCPPAYGHVFGRLLHPNTAS
jgi:hypothetical protein